MAKMLKCSTPGCKHILLGNTEDDVLRKAAEHAREHGIPDISADMMQKFRADICEIPWKILDTTR